MKKLLFLLSTSCVITMAQAAEYAKINSPSYQDLLYKDVAADEKKAWVGYQYWDPNRGGYSTLITHIDEQGKIDNTKELPGQGYLKQLSIRESSTGYCVLAMTVRSSKPYTVRLYRTCKQGSVWSDWNEILGGIVPSTTRAVAPDDNWTWIAMSNGEIRHYDSYGRLYKTYGPYSHPIIRLSANGPCVFGLEDEGTVMENCNNGSGWWLDWREVNIPPHDNRITAIAGDNDWLWYSFVSNTTRYPEIVHLNSQGSKVEEYFFDFQNDTFDTLSEAGYCVWGHAQKSVSTLQRLCNTGSGWPDKWDRVTVQRPGL